MKLSEAIRKAINEKGIDNVKANFMGFMMDYHAFEDDKLAKVVLSQLAKKGYMPKVFDTVAQKDEIQVNALKNSIINEFAFDKQVVTRIFEEFDAVIGRKKIKVIVKKKNTNSQKQDNQPQNINPQPNNIQQQNVNQPQNNGQQQTYNQQQNNYQQPFNNRPYFSPDNEVILTQPVETYWNIPNRDVGNPYNRPFQRQTESRIKSDENISKKHNRNRIKAWKIFAIIVAIGLNVPTYYVSGWWLILTIILTIATILMFIDDDFDDDMRIWIGYALLIAVFITIFTPIPWWILLLEIIGYVIAFMVICMA